MDGLVKDQPSLSIVKRLLASKRTEHTRKAYEYDLTVFGSFIGRDIQTILDEEWKELDVTIVSAYLEWLTQQVSNKTGRVYSTSTIARKITAIKELLTEAYYLGYFDKNKLDYIKDRIEAPQVTNQHHSTISPNDQNKLLDLARSFKGLKGLRDYAMFRLWLDTGLRRAELAALKVEDLVTLGNVYNIKVRHGKGNRQRAIPIEDGLAELLEQWIRVSEQTPRQPLFCQVRRYGSEYQVVNPDKHIDPMSLYRLVKWYCQKAGIKSEVTAHSFRVSLVTDMLDGNAPLPHVQNVTGHKDTQMITQVYNRNVYNQPISKYRKHELI